jgi:hypothetical protein
VPDERVLNGGTRQNALLDCFVADKLRRGLRETMNFVRYHGVSCPQYPVIAASEERTQTRRSISHKLVGFPRLLACCNGSHCDCVADCNDDSTWGNCKNFPTQLHV